jgi:predicted CXXCH cytochrome family protein
VSDAKSPVFPTNVATTCAACHADAKHMTAYKIPTSQFADYQKSVHYNALTKGNDLSAPTCNDCHGNHGAVPPGINWVGNVCGQCHSLTADLFKKSVHAKAFAEMGNPGCVTCHENHGIQTPGDFMLGLGDKAVCSTCHTAEDKGGKTAVEMRALIDSLSTETQKAGVILLRADHAGVEVSQAQFDLNGAKDALVKARNAVHSYTVAPVKQEVETGLAISVKAYARGVRAMEELRFRRVWLGVFLVVILALIAGLVMKIRQADRRPVAGSPPKH